jgi:hypothetical protein
MSFKLTPVTVLVTEPVELFGTAPKVIELVVVSVLTERGNTP